MSIAQTTQDVPTSAAHRLAERGMTALLATSSLRHRRNVATAHRRVWAWGGSIVTALLDDEEDHEAGKILDVIEPILETLQDELDLAAALAEALAEVAGLGRVATAGTDDADAESPLAVSGAPPGAERAPRPKRRAMACAASERKEGSHHGLPRPPCARNMRPHSIT